MRVTSSQSGAENRERDKWKSRVTSGEAGCGKRFVKARGTPIMGHRRMWSSIVLHKPACIIKNESHHLPSGSLCDGYVWGASALSLIQSHFRPCSFTLRWKGLPFDCTLYVLNMRSELQSSINMPRHAPPPPELPAGTLKAYLPELQPSKCPDHSPCHKQSTKATVCLIKKTRFTLARIPQVFHIHFNEMHLVSVAKGEFQMAA